MWARTRGFKESGFVRGEDRLSSSTMMRSFVILVFMASSTNALPVNETEILPSYLKPCRQDDPSLNECIRNSINTLIRNIKSGSEVLGVPSIDPLAVPVADLSFDSGNLTLLLTLKDISIMGMSQINVTSVKASLADYKFEIASKTPFFEVHGMFICDGGVLTFPLHSSGAFFVNMTDVTAVWILYYHEEVPSSGGPSHFKIDDFGLDIIPSDIQFDFGAEMDGDNELGEAMNTFLNGNSHEIFNDVKPRITDLLGHIFSDLGNSVLASYSASTLLPEK
ncbi:protein takeout [Anabrus simplex]|uniref:protein takeout n=1 Tax=Anabrus simplex TaxID=316456 RepID=UPI0035A277CC